MNHKMLYLAGLLTEEEARAKDEEVLAELANNMTLGGDTPTAAPLGNTLGDGEQQQEDAELDELNSQMQRVMGRLLPLIAKMKNRQKGFIVLHQIGQAVQNALKLSDTQVKNATLGNMPRFGDHDSPEFAR